MKYKGHAKMIKVIKSNANEAVSSYEGKWCLSLDGTRWSLA